MKQKCTLCGSAQTTEFFSVDGMPIHIGIQWATQEAARQCPRGDIRLIYCSHCGHISNAVFEPEILAYSEAYDNSLYFSPLFKSYTEAIAQHLIARYDLHGKTVVEIGCGKGDFLKLLCILGENRGIGFDPSYEFERDDSPAANVSFIQDFYSEKYTESSGDLICSRYVFEHIPEPAEFLAMLRRSIGSKHTTVYFEVPNVQLILRDMSVWDIIYEHCSYFSVQSLSFAFQQAGFRVNHIEEGYDGQFIGIEAQPVEMAATASDQSARNLELLARQVANFATQYQHLLQTWRDSLRQMGQTGEKTVVWGAGAKCVSFLNLLHVTGQIQYAVDINPHKHGKFLPGTGQEIISPEALVAYQPDTVIIMNPIYRHEIQAQLHALGLNPKLMEIIIQGAQIS